VHLIVPHSHDQPVQADIGSTSATLCAQRQRRQAQVLWRPYALKAPLFPTAAGCVQHAAAGALKAPQQGHAQPCQQAPCHEGPAKAPHWRGPGHVQLDWGPVKPAHKSLPVQTRQDPVRGHFSAAGSDASSSSPCT
jgi:hypothetical protein